MRPIDEETTRQRQDAMLQAYRDEGSLSVAASVSGVPSVWHKRWMKSDPQYAERFCTVKAEREAAGLKTGKSTARGRPRESWDEKQSRFLAAFAQFGLVLPAADASGVAFTLHYRWLKQDPEYAAKFEAVKGEADAAGIGEREMQERLATREHGPVTQGPRYERTQAKKRAFLDALAVLGTMRDAAEYVGMTAQQAVGWARVDAAFATEMASIRAATEDIARARISEQRSRAGKASWADEERRAEWARRQSEDLWTPERRAEQSRISLERFADPELRAARSETMRQRWQDPEYAARIAEAQRKNWQDPEYKARMMEAQHSPEARAKRSEATKAQWAAKSPEERKSQLRGARSAFKGGHGITRIEAKVIAWLGDHDIAIIPHKIVADYALDIYVPHLKLDIECDGGHFHDETTAEREQTRDATLTTQGITVLRLTETEIKSGDFSRLHEALGVSQ